MRVKESVVLVTGANGGIGRAFVQELLTRGAAKIYLGARDIASVQPLLAASDRLVPLTLDITKPDQVAEAAKLASDVTLLINNAGAAVFTGALSAKDTAGARQEMEVNYFGVLSLAQAFRDTPAFHHGGAIVNLLSILALVTLPVAGTYSASKAAALALTRTLRAELKGRGVQVLGVLPVQVDTAMGAPLPEPKLTPAEVAAGTLDALEANQDEVFPGGPVPGRGPGVPGGPGGHAGPYGGTRPRHLLTPSDREAIMRNRQSITLSAALLAAAGGLAGCKPTEAAGPDPLTVERRVVVAQVQPAAGAPQSYTGIRIDLEGQVNRLDVLLGAQPGTYAARSMRKWIKPGAQTWRPLARYRQTVLRAAEDVEDAFKTLVELEARNGAARGRNPFAPAVARTCRNRHSRPGRSRSRTCWTPTGSFSSPATPWRRTAGMPCGHSGSWAEAGPSEPAAGAAARQVPPFLARPKRNVLRSPMADHRVEPEPAKRNPNDHDDSIALPGATKGS